MRLTILCAGVLALAACARGPEPAEPVTATPTAEMPAVSESERLNAWFAEKYEQELQFSPIQLTFLGRDEQNDRIDDMSVDAEIAQLEWRKASVEEMEASFDYAALSDEARLSYDLWKYQTELADQSAAFRGNAYVFQQMSGHQAFLATFLINFHRVEDEADMRAYIARVREVPRALDQLLTRAKASAERGVRPPKFAYEGVIDQSRKVVSGAPFDDGEASSLWADMQQEIATLESSGRIDAERAAALREEARSALVEQLLPAYRRLIAWAEDDMANAATNPSGIGDTMPDGAAYYDHLLRVNTTTELTAEEIHQIGLAEVERIKGEMVALKEQVGFDGDLDAWFAYIDSDPRFVYPNTDAGRQAYIDAANEALDNIEKELPNYFGLLPKAELVVKRVEPFREQDGAAQHYFPGTPDGSRPGIYYAHLSDMNAMPIPELEVIAYHEGLPGHHMQISIAQELDSVPMFRTQSNFTAYAEGWGLYAEWLAKEMPNTYQDPYSEYGRLSSEMWRAVRLVVDTGLHAKGWTEQQAVDYFDANTAVPLTAIRSEVQRYLVIPGQATAYKIGMLEIQALRRDAEAELGEAFDIRGFHDAVLGGGGLPLELLERRVDGWVASQKAAQPD